MKLRKFLRLTALLLALLLVLSGCSTEHASTTPENTGVSTATTTAPESTVPSTTEEDIEIESCILPETVDNPDNLPVLNWLYLTFFSSFTPSEEKNETLNQINQALADRDMPFRLQLTVVTVGHGGYHDDLFTMPEIQELAAKADIIHVQFFGEAEAAYLLPITEYVTGDTEPALKNAVPHDAYWLQATLNGEIYGIPTLQPETVCEGWWVDDALLTEYGLTVEDFSKLYWEMDDVFAEIYEKNGNKPFLKGYTNGIIIGNPTRYYYPDALRFELGNVFHAVGSCYAIDYSGSSPKVINYLDTDYTRSMQSALQRYSSAGYCMAPDDYSYPVSYRSTYSDFAFQIDGVWRIPTGTAMLKTTQDDYINGIGVNTQYQEEAVSLLKLLSEDKAFRTLFYGDSSTGAASPLSYLILQQWFDTSDAGNGTAPIESGKTAAETNAAIIDRIDIRWLPITFDFTSVQAETDAVNAVLKSYFSGFSSLSEEKYDQMLADIQAAGSDKILAELQRQLDEWLAENPEWTNF